MSTKRGIDSMNPFPATMDELLTAAVSVVPQRLL